MQIGAGTIAATALAPPSMQGEAVTAAPKDTALVPLALGSILPAGWLKTQLRIQADGLTGHLDEVWPDVGPASGWLGGKGESWERGPYFVDGLLPLAWQLNDPALKAKALRFIDWTLDHQQANGMIGPASNDDWWPRMVMVKVLAQFHELTADPRVLPVMTRYFHYQLKALPNRPLRDWGKYRWQDEVLIVQWLHQRTSDPELLKLETLLQQQGFDWVESFREFKYTTPVTHSFLSSTDPSGNKPEGMQTHGVNNGQALKTAAVLHFRTKSASDWADYQRQIGKLDQYHGMPNGMFSCDEHLAGLDPSHGTELCTVVETMFSMEVALAAFGEASIGDRIEKIAFNALPGTFTDSMWAHQYDQQPNQVQVSLNSKPWTTNGPESNLYGLAPNFGCCTANYHQGWPKFTASLWMHASDGGLVAALYAPCEVTTTAAGQPVQVKVETEYPFREKIRLVVMPESTARFPISFRIPAWADGASIRVNGKTVNATVNPGTFTRLERIWRAGDSVDLMFPMKPKITRGFNRSVSLSRGPVIFAFDPGGSWVKLVDRGAASDWQVFPTSAWNYGLILDEVSAAKLEVIESPVGVVPFGADGAPVRIRVMARRVNKWRSEDGVAMPVPSETQDSGREVKVLELIPYAAAKLRITAFPGLSL